MVLPKYIVLSLIGIVTSSVSPLSAYAAVAPSTMNVSATVLPTCLITLEQLACGIYTGTVSDISTTIIMTCSNTVPYAVALDAGTASDATVMTRRMTGATGAYLAYALFRDAGRTLNWGVTAGADTVAGTATGNAQSLTVYGRIAASQFVTPGSYADTVTATVTY